MNSQYENLAGQYSAKPDGYYETTRSEMLPFIPAESSSILEIGCSSGAFGKLIKNERPGTVVWGIEPDEESAKKALKNLDHVICSTFSTELEELKGKKFDVICMNDVLEHMVNPDTVLLDCKSFLSPNGMIVASIPNILHFYNITQILLHQDWKYEDSGIMDNTHLRFFTKKSIIRMFEGCGYNIARIEGINASFGMKYRLANALTLGHLKDWKYVQFVIQAQPLSKDVL